MLKLRLEKDLDLERISAPIVRKKDVGKVNVLRRKKHRRKEPLLCCLKMQNEEVTAPTL